MPERLSRFVVSQELGDAQLLHSTLTGASVLASSDLLSRLRHDGVDGPTLARLRELGIVQTPGVDERATLMHRLDSGAFSSKSLNPIVCLTSDCNARCIYCYEEGMARQRMQSDAMHATEDWISRKAEEGHFDHVHVTLFGGEPLLEMDLLEEFCEDLSGRLNSLSFYVSTNGTLLTREVAERLVALGVRGGQVSVDGVARLHDARRPFLGGEGTYGVILRNIANVADVFDVCVKVNFDGHNSGCFVELLDELDMLGLRESVTMKLEAVAPTRGSVADSGHHCALYAYDPTGAELANVYDDLIGSAQERGFRVTRDTGHSSPCMFTSEHQVAIDQSGRLYKCVSAIGLPEFAVGSVFDDEYAPAYARCLATRYLALDCLDNTDCPFVPVCGGGCQYEAFVLRGEFGSKVCKRSFHEAHTKALMLLQLERARPGA